jgi:uncharacterized Fe-S cluster protein YjdI
MGTIKEYSNGDVTVTWEAEKCIHSAICVRGLPGVFQPKERPWIKIDAASTQELIDQIKKCPSGALGYYMTKDEKHLNKDSMETKVEVMENGPLLVHGTLEVNIKGKSETKKRTTAFCRCGASQNKPYCDGAHVKEGFEG